ncbi:MAG TPA: DUF1015 domain-containing protein [Anaerolineales bacterium]|nr:DUF1015 domain-containing protein [Anaerolineales bacterium]
MKTFVDIGVQIPQIYLPKADLDLNKWAVIACDQFTSQPEYWQKVEELVGKAPSTLRLVLPEVFLGKPGEVERIQSIQASMQAYLDQGLIQPREGMIYVERSVSGRNRKGILLCLDLEKYDFNKGSTSLIRATEGTIIERLPPRMKIRQGAPLELPHILVLIDDPLRTVIEPLAQAAPGLEKLYDFELMLGSGHLRGYAVDPVFEAQIISALRTLAQPEVFAAKYGISSEKPVLLFAMGDGNHSLATAKAVWDKMKLQVGLDHPARYALVEIENVHDEGLEFEPIHRVVFGLKKNIYAAMQNYFGENFSLTQVADPQKMIEHVDHAGGSKQVFGIISNGGWATSSAVEISHPSSNLPVGTLQAFLDVFLQDGGAEKIDYVHGADVVTKLGVEKGNAGFYVPGMHKSDLFKTVILDGALPRKTFSMGEAKEKRFYLEARRII